MKTAVLGAGGFIGSHLARSFGSVVATTRSTLNFERPSLAQLKLEEQGYEAVVIAAAAPNIAYCQGNPGLAYQVNVLGTLELARQVAERGMQVIWFSSDYVFNGVDGDYADDAPLCPNTEYGRQKAEVELRLPELTDNYLILRLSKTYGLKKNDATLLDEIASKLRGGQLLRAAHDQRFAPTLIDDVVQLVHLLQQRRARGLYNLCCPQSWSRFEVARLLAEKLQVADRVVPVALHEIPAMLGRPLNTSLRPQRLLQELDYTFLPLEVAAETVSANWRQ